MCVVGGIISILKYVYILYILDSRNINFLHIYKQILDLD
jgi:hypothetical protein